MFYTFKIIIYVMHSQIFGSIIHQARINCSSLILGGGILCGFHVRACEKPDYWTGSGIYMRTDKLITHVALYFSPPIHKTDPFNITHDMEQV